MKLRVKWAFLPTTLAMVLALATVAQSNPVQTPLRSPVTVSGNVNATQEGGCGFVGGTPNQVVVVNSPTALKFSLQGGGQPTLMIAGPGGRNQCVMADNRSGGTVEVPGLWQPGNYSVFVGNRTRGSFPFTLTITQEN